VKNDEHTIDSFGHRPRRSNSRRSTTVQASARDRLDTSLRPKLKLVDGAWEVRQTQVHVARRAIYLSTVTDCLSRRVLASRIDFEAAAMHGTALLVDAIGKYGLPGIVWTGNSGFLVSEEFNQLIWSKGIRDRAFAGHPSRDTWSFLGGVPDVADDSDRICPLSPLTS
jgi:hypothetical protein